VDPGNSRIAQVSFCFISQQPGDTEHARAEHPCQSEWRVWHGRLARGLPQARHRRRPGRDARATSSCLLLAFLLRYSRSGQSPSCGFAIRHSSPTATPEAGPRSTPPGMATPR